MRALSLMAAFVLLAGTFCGGGQQEQAEAVNPVPQGAGDFAVPPESFDKITEDEMNRFIEALPVLEEALVKAGFQPQPGEGKSVDEDLSAAVEAMKDVPGVTDALKKTRHAWPEFRITMYKIMAAAVAMNMDMQASMVEGMADDTPGVKEAREEVEQTKPFCSLVPEENKGIVVSQVEALAPLFGSP